MIAVRRPPLGDNELAQRAAVETDRAIARAAAGDRVDFRPEVNRDFRPLLLELFNEKCAYCESAFGVAAQPDIENFRPKSAVKEAPGFPGYYWLAYRWDNLLLACQYCNHGKGNHFPIAGSRASSPADDLAAEQPLLLDPCIDNPADHLMFSEEGHCAGVTERGKVTVQILNLDRPALVAARKEAALLVEHTLQLVMMAAAKEQQQDRLGDLLSERQPYTAIRRHVAARLLDRRG